MKLTKIIRKRLISTILWIIKDSKKEYWQDNTLREVFEFHFELIEKDFNKGLGRLKKVKELLE